MNCEKCKNTIPKFENYGTFYYCKHCDESFGLDNEEMLEKEEMEIEEFNELLF